AGQAAGVGVIAAGGSYLEMALTQLTINFRYALMGFSLSQKLDKTFRLPQRMAAAFGITDEIFAVASAQSGTICPAYMYGLILIAFLGWTLGPLGAAGQIHPSLSLTLGRQRMFLAIIVPVSRKKKSVLAVVALAAACSILFRYVFTAVSSGFAIILCAVLASIFGAIVFPIPEEERT
ncbi:MAG: AzlC family ABC transporter permease, partial [Ruminococcus callidus]